MLKLEKLKDRDIKKNSNTSNDGKKIHNISYFYRCLAIQHLFFKISLIIIYLLFIIIQETWLIPQIILK